MINFSIMVAMDEQQGIGKGGTLPWHIPGDLKYFKNLTTKTKLLDKKNVVIMGRKTWESLPQNFRPLVSRINIVLTRNKKFLLPVGVIGAQDFDEAFHILEEKEIKNQWESIFVIGGEQIFNEAIKKPACHKIYVTHILGSFQCDTFFPPYLGRFQEIEFLSPVKEGGFKYFFSVCQKKE